MHKENSRIAWSFKQVLSLTKKLTKTCKLTADNKLPVGLNPLFAHYVQPCDFVFMRPKPLGNKCSFAFLYIVQIPIQIPCFSDKFTTQKNPQKNIHTSKFSHTVYVTTKKQGCRQKGRKKICLKTNLHLLTKRQQQQSETSRTSSGCTGRQGHCRRSALLSHPVLMLREKDSERCLCSDKEEKICAKRWETWTN